MGYQAPNLQTSTIAAILCRVCNLNHTHLIVNKLKYSHNSQPMTMCTDYEKKLHCQEMEALHDQSTAFDPIRTNNIHNTQSFQSLF